MELNRNPNRKKHTNPVLEETSKTKSELRRNIKLPDDVFFTIKALNKVKPLKQYELIETMAKHYIASLTETEKEFYEFQLQEIKKEERKKAK
ncbi:hypothetical protein P8917_10055 [Bacillus atrophaeus]|uniref:hypothetical protein n=1 Tax=Bacillus atrophaeus TaxID=1452 RepID=UPI00227F559E|nr:hypothetical protein [Bacillus atrophaeus]MCY8497786.1 hypothetical protein [Bacillus atrophaeus]MCY8814909.1 hypothetical protein [Bacillus atrophaeus]MCY8821545.1 hypothetical protein [Bacillus atrophaeus]MCY8830975.1 hypothetical protein [Bacillus atrophaeus]MCY8835234.1 hypothetical protein [Bacillus atrophaeus]